MTEQETNIHFGFLIKRLSQLLFHPSDAWTTIRDQESAETVQTHFLFPFLGLVVLAVFLSSMWLGAGWTNAIRYSTGYAMSLFLTYWGGAYWVDWVWKKRTNGPSALNMWRQVIGYSLLVPMLTKLVSILSSMNDLLAILQLVVVLGNLYIFYILWEALIVLVGLKEDHLFIVMAILGIFCLGCPMALERIFLLLLNV